MIKKIHRRIRGYYKRLLDEKFLTLDKKLIRRYNPIGRIPNINFRRGGKTSYAEWSYVIGLFQSIIYQNLEIKANNKILDIGCGTGLLSMAAYPYIHPKGNYIGIDVMIDDILFCRNHYQHEYNQFIHHEVFNESYSPNQTKGFIKWDVKSNSVDLLTALSVWTHLRKDDSIYYFKEIFRVLKPGSKAIVTVFLKDDNYKESMNYKNEKNGFIYNTPKNRWVFDKEVEKDWFTTNWAKDPEQAIAIDNNSLNILLKDSGLCLLKHYPGSWKDIPGLYFQDILILYKPSE